MILPDICWNITDDLAPLPQLQITIFVQHICNANYQTAHLLGIIKYPN